MDICEGADLSGTGDDARGLGVGGARWWVRYRFQCLSGQPGKEKW